MNPLYTIDAALCLAVIAFGLGLAIEGFYVVPSLIQWRRKQ